MGVRIELPPSAWKQVCEQADREWRTPKQQAEYLILRALGWELPPLEPGESESQPAQLEQPGQPVREGGGAP